MSHTNQTQYYGLPQYVGTDIINPLVDTNGAYQNIDTAMHNIAEVAGQSTTDIAGLQTKVGSGVFATTAQDATDAVNELYGELNDATTGVKDRVTSVENEVDTLQSQMVTAQGNIVDLQNNKASQSDVTALGTRVSVVEGDVTTLNGSVSALITKVNSKEVNFYNRHFLFVGDSYGEEDGEWVNRVISLLGLGGRATNLAAGGAGFYSTNAQYKFLTQLSNFVGSHTAEEIAQITDIVICGGLNDSISSSLSDYSNVTSAMREFNTYAKAQMPYAKISLGYIGNAKDNSSVLAGRNYLARYTCRYFYYLIAQQLGWNVLHNVEYALTGNQALIDTDGVHPSSYGSEDLASAIAGAIVNGSADYNYPLYNAGVSSDLGGSITGNIAYQIHNNMARLIISAFFMTFPSSVTFETGTLKAIGTLGSMYFNNPVEIFTSVRLTSAIKDGTPLAGVISIPARVTFLNDKVYVTLEDFDGSASGHTYTWSTDGGIVITDCEKSFEAMLLA